MSDDLLGYDEKFIKKLSFLKPVKDLLDRTHGVGNWGLHEVAKYKYDKDQAELKENSDKLATLDAERASLNNWIEERAKHYLKGYENPAPNDIASIYQMARIEWLINQAQEKLQSFVPPEDFKKYADVIGSLSTKHGALQTMLGIARNQREESETGIDDVKKFVEASRKMLDKYALYVECAACQEKNIKMYLGFFLSPFMGYVPIEIKTQCPKCRNPIYIQRAITKDPATLPPLAEEKQEDEQRNKSG